MTISIASELISKGVSIPDPASVQIGSDIRLANIESGACLMPGSRISGSSTIIGKGSVIGAEGPAVVKDCQIGRNVSLGSGFFDAAVFLDGSSMGGGAHIRPGTILEEESSGAHTVGLKQTLLLPFVTLGSLVNFCDCLMAGGTSRRNHSEVGSSYIHFNFTPHQDKATASLIGDVPRGVLLDQPPIFLGGQGGLVGPARIAFGTVIAAGHVARRDVTEPGRLVVPEVPAPADRAYDQRVYGSIDRLIVNNLAYIGNVVALRQWYRAIRLPGFGTDSVSAACYTGAVKALEVVLKERVKRLAELAAKVDVSAGILSARPGERDRAIAAGQRRFSECWQSMEQAISEIIRDEAGIAPPGPVSQVLAETSAGKTYLEWIAALAPATRSSVTTWLDGVVGRVTRIWNFSS